MIDKLWLNELQLKCIWKQNERMWTCWFISVNPKHAGLRLDHSPPWVVFTAGCGSAAAPVGFAGERGASETGPCRQACRAAILDCYHILGAPWQGPAESSDWMGAYQVSVEGRPEVSASPLANRVVWNAAYSKILQLHWSEFSNPISQHLQLIPVRVCCHGDRNSLAGS